MNQHRRLDGPGVQSKQADLISVRLVSIFDESVQKRLRVLGDRELTHRAWCADGGGEGPRRDHGEAPMIVNRGIVFTTIRKENGVSQPVYKTRGSGTPRRTLIGSGLGWTLSVAEVDNPQAR